MGWEFQYFCWSLFDGSFFKKIGWGGSVKKKGLEGQCQIRELQASLDGRGGGHPLLLFTQPSAGGWASLASHKGPSQGGKPGANGLGPRAQSALEPSKGGDRTTHNGASAAMERWLPCSTPTPTLHSANVPKLGAPWRSFWEGGVPHPVPHAGGPLT